MTKPKRPQGRPHRVEKCPRCDKETLHINYEVRKNHPFGEKSSPRYVPKKRTDHCTNVKTDKKGNIIWACGYHREYTSPPLLNVDNPYGTRQERM